MKYLYNNEMERIDTPNKAYLLGLYYSDGYVMYNTNKFSYYSGIALIKSDKELLQKIKTYFPFFTYKEDDRMVSIRCNKKKFCEDLIKNGVLPNKSSINKNNLRFPKILPELYSHFIRGMFDGDGGICFSKTNSINSKRIYIVGNNYFVIKKIQEILFNEGIPFKLNYRRGGSSVIRGKLVNFKTLNFTLYNTNREIIEKLNKYFYTNANLYLKRKSIIFNDWQDQEKPICPRCNKNKTFWMDKKSKFIGCHSCKRYSTLDKKYNLPPKIDIKFLYCTFCSSKNVVNNGNSRNKKTREIIGYRLKCKNCCKVSQRKFETAPN